jgi:hypothetical protein
MNTARGRPTVAKAHVNRITQHRLRGTGGQVMAIGACVRTSLIKLGSARGSVAEPLYVQSSAAE